MNLSHLKHALRKGTSLSRLRKNVEILTSRKCSEIGKNIDKTIIEDKSAGYNSETDDDMLEPTNCCMSGCANCVWIQYAEKLSKSLADSDEDVQKIIMDKVQDANMRAFLSLELRCRKLVR